MSEKDFNKLPLYQVAALCIGSIIASILELAFLQDSVSLITSGELTGQFIFPKNTEIPGDFAIIGGVILTIIMGMTLLMTLSIVLTSAERILILKGVLQEKPPQMPKKATGLADFLWGTVLFVFWVCISGPGEGNFLGVDIFLVNLYGFVSFFLIFLMQTYIALGKFEIYSRS